MRKGETGRDAKRERWGSKSTTSSAWYQQTSAQHARPRRAASQTVIPFDLNFINGRRMVAKMRGGWMGGWRWRMGMGRMDGDQERGREETARVRGWRWGGRGSAGDGGWGARHPSLAHPSPGLEDGGWGYESVRHRIDPSVLPAHGTRSPRARSPSPPLPRSPLSPASPPKSAREDKRRTSKLGCGGGIEQCGRDSTWPRWDTPV